MHIPKPTSYKQLCASVYVKHDVEKVMRGSDECHNPASRTQMTVIVGTTVKQGFLFTHRSRDRQEPALITVINLNLSERAEHEGAERRRERGTAEERE